MSEALAYLNIAELIRDYYDKSVNTYLNQEVTVNNATLVCDIYRVAEDTVLTNAIFTGCVGTDANTQIIIGKNMTVESEVTLTPPYRCKGLIIGDIGTFTNEGTISMTARGASGQGVNIPLHGEYIISAIGGTGGTGSGVKGGSPASGVLSCGGGGSGAGYNVAGGSGGSGTSFSGGPGGGGSADAAGTAGSSTGGAGGNANASTAQECQSTGGAGNPKGTPKGVEIPDGVFGTGQGTGGLLVIMASDLVQLGTVEAKGVVATVVGSSSAWQDRCCPGGSSGGGCIVLLSRNRDITGTYSVAGGVGAHATNVYPASFSKTGGAGGDGAYSSILAEDLMLQNIPLEVAYTDKAHLENIEPSQGGRLLALTDKDELLYELSGQRHRAVDASGELDMTAFTPPSQLSPGVNQIGMLDDVDITSPTDGQGLTYDEDTQKWVNGPGGMHEYSTTEKVVGTWIDGKPLYEKMISIPMTSNNGSSGVYKEASYAHNISDIDFIFPINIFFTDANRSFCIGSPYFIFKSSGTVDEWSAAVLVVDTSNVTISTYRDRSSWACKLIVRYTKTTDTPTQT